MKQTMVVGATSDIGVHVAYALAKRGHSLTLTGRNKEKLSDLKHKIISEFSVSVDTYELDITEMNSFDAFYTSLPQKPDFVFVLVGYYEDQNLAREDWHELNRTIQINFTGVAALVNHISLEMEARNSGSITVVSSVAGVRGRKLNYIYGSAKAGLTTYLSGLRSLLHSHGVHVGTILLGPVYTKMSFGHKLMPWLTLKPEDAGEKIVKAGLGKKDQVYIRWPWRFIMLVIRLIPEWLFKRLPAF